MNWIEMAQNKVHCDKKQLSGQLNNYNYNNKRAIEDMSRCMGCDEIYEQ
jgi:hypothetical protein